MKKMISKYIVLVLVFIIAGACKKGFLDQVPDDRITIDEIFTRKKTTEQYLANVYSYVRDESNQWTDNPWEGCSDEADMTWARAGYNTYFMNLGSWDPTSGFFDFWTSYYKGIRSATYFMENVNRCKEILDQPGGADLIKRYKAEARFLRAYFYFCLIRQYGPVPLLGESILAPDVPFDQTQIPRANYDECVNFIATELDKAGQDLPMQQSDELEYGRITKPVTMAVKARMFLYAASPLFNGNADYASFVNQDGKQLTNTTYDPAKWAKAADAAKAVIDLNLFQLYRVNASDGSYDPFTSCRDAVMSPWNKEVIFARAANSVDQWEVHSSPRFAGGWSGIGATQQIVDAFFMENGKTIDETGSGYVATGFSTADTRYTKSGTYNMYVGREPRFYVCITYNGMTWFNKSEGEKKVELFNTGNTGKRGSYDYSRTGYLVRKNYHPDTYPRLGRYVYRPFVLFRLGEMYLNYAEALNESQPGNPDILKYVNAIRNRAGIPDLPSGLSQADMRERIRRERRVELAFECHRYFDTRRWKIAEQTDGGPFYGMNVDAGTNLTDISFYQKTVFETRVFQKKHYLFPIPQFDIDRDKKLVQNPGW
ncbi:RagB/SusD family nutrient uptake outer membrane protein [Chitinophaga sp. 212800010-3]|uniref:RagB/SusD family nutrient uptake outer membrane protein n=1 Tax=unclassified Chitinophaga TaxID=2619133 RepID=UPI002DE36730|nr:RagB/SusD family nutrient uptake outer membrane protein [Chitinophaga sp. 212800010-3]